jgi:hypothetical protein
MTSYPVSFSVTRPERYDRGELALRVVLFTVLSVVGITMGAIFGLLYLGLPVVAAIALHRRGARGFLAQDAPSLERALRWVMSAHAYLMLLTDRFPVADPGVRFAIEPGAWSEAGRGPSPGGALLRLINGIPSAFVLGILGFASWLMWLVAALLILLTEHYPEALHAFQCGVLRWQARLFAYQASLVEAHPPYTFDTGDLAHPGGEPLAH